MMHTGSPECSEVNVMKRKAFTLIELLVVIAIIAILAAILFPVLAQARQAAKKAASISNSKQIMLGTIMYNDDQDDTAVLITAWGDTDAPVLVGGVGMKPWTVLTAPYIKNADIELDPQAPAYTPFGGTWPVTLTKLLQPQYGYNSYCFDRMFGGTVVTQNVLKASGVAAPSDTVFYVAKNARSEVQGLATPTGFWWFGAGTFNIQMFINPPWCNPTDPSVCTFWWGATAAGTQILGTNEAAGAYTGSGSLRGSGQMIVTWADGHVATKPWGAMAAGTNVRKTGTTWANGDNGIIVINDLAKYVWDEQ